MISANSIVPTDLELQILSGSDSVVFLVPLMSITDYKRIKFKLAFILSKYVVYCELYNCFLLRYYYYSCYRSYVLQQRSIFTELFHKETEKPKIYK